jgi:hypothetical protein
MKPHPVYLSCSGTRRTDMKRAFPALAILAVLGLALIPAACIKSTTSAELKASMEILGVETKWVSKYYQPWPPRLILVPVVSFKVKNISDKPLSYINFNAIFQAWGDKENLGDCFLAAIRGTPVPPAGTSDTISLKSNLGVEAKNLAQFKSNPAWKTYQVRLFAQSKGSPFVLLGEYEVSKTIDFKEPEPVGLGEKPSETVKK